MKLATILTVFDFTKQIIDTNKIIYKLIRKKPSFFRPPYNKFPNGKDGKEFYKKLKDANFEVAGFRDQLVSSTADSTPEEELKIDLRKDNIIKEIFSRTELKNNAIINLHDSHHNKTNNWIKTAIPTTNALPEWASPRF